MWWRENINFNVFPVVSHALNQYHVQKGWWSVNVCYEFVILTFLIVIDIQEIDKSNWIQVLEGAMSSSQFAQILVNQLIKISENKYWVFEIF